jgi:5-oxoprolinase (ATP-hydrolysing)
LIDCRPDDGDYEKEFVAQYRREFGFILSSRKLIVEDVRVRAIGKGKNIEQQAIEEAATPDCEPTSHAKYVFERQRERERESNGDGVIANTSEYRSYWGTELGWQDTPVFLLKHLKAKHSITGPAIIIDNTSTIIVGM